MPPKKTVDISEQLQDFRKVILQRLDSIDSNIKDLTTKLNETKTIAIQAANLADNAITQTALNKTLIDESNERIRKLEIDLDDQINRNMRSTLIFNGIEGTETNWDETSKLLADKISSLADEVTGIHDWIERAHRAKRRDKQVTTDNRPLPIIAKFCSWKQSEMIKTIIIDHKRNERDKTKHIYVEQMQSKELTARTNEAKKYRKELKSIHPEWKMFVSHPAKLMYKKPDKNKYDLLKAF